MSKEELRAYVLSNREDDEAIRELFSRRDPNAPSYSSDLSFEEVAEIVRRKIGLCRKNSKVGKLNFL